MKTQSRYGLARRGRLIVAALLAFAIDPPAALGSNQPNFVVMVADDLGWNDVGYHGSELATPNIDRLVSRGAELNQFYVQPTCTPTRAALMTGRYPSRYGMHARVSRWWHSKGVPLTERLLPEFLNDAGYATAICGKWHLGMSGREYLPLARGFDRQYGHLGGHIDYFAHTHDGVRDWHRDQRPLQEEGYSTELIAGEAVRLIGAHDESRPLFLYLPFNAPHSPRQAPKPSIAEFSHIPDAKRRTYAAMVSHLDRAIGDVVEAIDSRGWSSDTLVLFFSDNGGAPSVSADNTPLRGSKGKLYEGGVRVPATAVWNGTIKAGTTVNQPMHVVDLLPTLLGLAGSPDAAPASLDGRDVWPAIAKGQPLADRPILHNVRRERGAVRLGDWKLVRNGEANVTPPVVELFDLSSDPNEETNLADANPKKVAELAALLDAARTREREPDGMEMKKPKGVVPPEVWDFSASDTGGVVRP
ncbi:MAG: arylsulfatase [Planctomycetota bacterium]